MARTFLSLLLAVALAAPATAAPVPEGPLEIANQSQGTTDTYTIGAIADSGSALMLWGTNNVFAAVRSTSSEWSPRFTVANGGEFALRASQEFGKLIFAGAPESGRPFVVYLTANGKLVTSTYSGITFPTPSEIPIRPDSAGSSTTVDLRAAAMDVAPSGRALLVGVRRLRDQFGTFQADLIAVERSATGSWGAPEVVAPMDVTPPREQLAVAINDAGQALLLIDQDNEVDGRAKQLSGLVRTGAGWTGLQPLEASGVGGGQLSADMLPSGRAVGMWSRGASIRSVNRPAPIKGSASDALPAAVTALSLPVTPNTFQLIPVRLLPDGTGAAGAFVSGTSGRATVGTYEGKLTTSGTWSSFRQTEDDQLRQIAFHPDGSAAAATADRLWARADGGEWIDGGRTDGVGTGLATSRNGRLLSGSWVLAGPVNATTINWARRDCDGRDATFVGTAGADAIDGSGNGTDVIMGGSGDDTINANAGTDVVCGNGGNDVISGGAAGDRLLGDAGNDQIKGSTGDDALFGGSGNDRLEGEGQVDALDGGEGSDVCFDDDFDFRGCEAPLVGKASITPKRSTVRKGNLVALKLRWSHPVRWGLLHSVDLRLVKNGKTAGTVHASAETLKAKARGVGLVRSTVLGTGPTGKAMTIELVLKVKEKGRYALQLRATDDKGRHQGLGTKARLRVR
jgi:Ca2+-binding RTX toxin-like protein